MQDRAKLQVNGIDVGVSIEKELNYRFITCLCSCLECIAVCATLSVNFGTLFQQQPDDRLAACM